VPGRELPQADSTSAAVTDSAAAAAIRRRRRGRGDAVREGRLAAETRADGRETAASVTTTGSHALL
jgi:hypothetical protein